MKFLFHHVQRRPRTSYLSLVGFVLLLAMALTVVSYLPSQAASAATPAWTTFLGNNARTSYAASETIINQTTAHNLKVHWTASTTNHALITTEVMIANGMLYWGSWDGILHASDPATGHTVWTASLGTEPGGCSHKPKGVISSVTVATVTIKGVATSVVFVGAGKSNLYALNAHTGAILWQINLDTDPAAFLYSSTAFYQGSIYIGIASTGDCPLVQGKVVRVNASTGQLQNTFKLVPDGCLGGPVWGSPSIDEQTGMLYFGTGNVDKKSCTQSLPLEDSIVELKASDLSLVASWPLPKANLGQDTDYGSTPTLFQATINGVSHAMLGMVNKNGYYYALDRTHIAAGPLWKVRLSTGGAEPTKTASIPSSAYDGTHLYAAGSATTIGGQACAGSVRALNPNTGAFLWEDCLTSPVLAPVFAVPGLLVVGAGNSMDVVNSQTGHVLYTHQDTATNGAFWGTATINNGILYEGSKSGTLFAFGL